MTPCGYKIQDGKAVCDPAAAGRIRIFFHWYLEGFSIKEAKDMAGLNVSNSTAGNILKNKTYLGDDFYPAIIDRETFDKVAKEREMRYDALSRFRHTDPVPPVPVRDTFRMVSAKAGTARTNEQKENALFPQGMRNCAKRAAYLYSLIRYDPEGDRTLSLSARAMIPDRMENPKERFERSGNGQQLKKALKEDTGNVS